MGVDSPEAANDLLGFYEFLFDDREGYVHAATKENSSGLNAGAWKEHFFKWPTQKEDLVRFTNVNKSRRDVYVAPSLFREREAIKENVIGANVVWVELDDPAPSNVDSIPAPTCRIASGGSGHEHWYWKIEQVLNSDQLDLVNRALTHLLDADPSGWDSTQVLRPPGTYNHKRQRETFQILRSDVVLDIALFSGLPTPPKKDDITAPEYIPPVEKVVAKYPFPQKVMDLFQSRDPHDRSDALMALGYYLAEMGMAKPEILSMLMNADERWGKFKGRDDRMRRLLEIVSIAVGKYPPQSAPPVVHDLVPMGFKTLLNTEVELEWQWEGFLQKNGYFLLTGPTGVGKTQFTLDAAGHMALGKEFLGKPTRKSRIGFFSLEMGITDLKHFLQQLQYSFTAEEHDALEENLLIFPLGEPLYFANEAVRAQLDQVIGDYKLDGIIIDSLGSATEENVSDEKIKQHFHWNDKIRQKHDLFTWYIHHHRKANGDNRKPNKLSDVYGSQYITSYATTVACLWQTDATPNLIQFIELKKRLAPKEPPFIISRDEQLHFVRAQPGQALYVPQTAADRPFGQGQPTQGSDAAGGKSAGNGNDWSVGPKSFQDTLAEKDYGVKSTGKDVFNIDFGDIP